jgi:hypothetical protein
MATVRCAAGATERGSTSGVMRRPRRRYAHSAAALFAILAVAGPVAARVALDPLTGARIVNGTATHAYPAVGAMLYASSGPITPNNAGIACSGTLIGCETFLVAAHCVVDDPDPSHYAVYLQHAGIVPVTAVLRHPLYMDATFPKYDAAVLKLASWVTGVTPQPINRIDPEPFIPTAGTIVGFGQTAGGAGDYGIKRVGTVLTQHCPAGLPAGATDSDALCWTFSGAMSNTCNGDSGGPLLLDIGAGSSVAGITSGGTSNTCLATDHSYDANAYTHRAFILNALGADSTAACGNLPPIGDPDTTVVSEDGALGSAHATDVYTIDVPAGTNLLRVTLNGEDTGAFDPDLFVKHGPSVSPSTYDCKDDGANAFAACTIAAPAAGTWSIAAVRASGAGTYQLTATMFGGSPAVCGNGVRDFDEDCDGADAQRCAGLCRADCTCPPPVCGNGVVEAGEQCDGTDVVLCAGPCTASCQCAGTCSIDGLTHITTRLRINRFRLSGLLLNLGNEFSGADPRQGFTLGLSQGTAALTISIPANDPGWARSRPDRGRFRWTGLHDGVTRVAAVDRTLRNGTWKLVVAGGAVPGVAGFSVDVPIDVTVSMGAAGACATATYP